jgi:hypothetical protein
MVSDYVRIAAVGTTVVGGPFLPRRPDKSINAWLDGF